jgi:hypothetical protein
MLSDSWVYDSAINLLNAATSCGFVCENSFVAASCVVEAPFGCDCQLVAVIVEDGYRATNGPCVGEPVAVIQLILDLCVDVPGSNETPDPAGNSESAYAAAVQRWQILRGINTYKREMSCSSIDTGLWRCETASGGNARWSIQIEVKGNP